MQHLMEENMSYELLNTIKIGIFIRKNNDDTNQCFTTSNSNNQLITVVPHSSSTNSNKTTITVKQNKNLKMRNIRQLFDPKLPKFDKASDDLDNWAKDFCIKTVMTGANKMVSRGYFRN